MADPRANPEGTGIPHRLGRGDPAQAGRRRDAPIITDGRKADRGARPCARGTAQFVRFARDEAHWDDIALPAQVAPPPVPSTPVPSEPLLTHVDKALPD